jgi:predicted hotdog family 3-hydroxylacyl-ACP dehydratase
MIEPGACRIDRDWIARHIPHQGSMCLLDSVESWGEETIVCRTSTHRLLENPLRANGSLGIATAIEYAAQAMAVHSALLRGESEMLEESELPGQTAAPKSGYLTSVRDVRWQRARLDDIAQDLQISVRRFSGNEINVLYDFEIHADTLLLMQGRASVMLNAGDRE